MTKIHAESSRGFKRNVDILNQINENGALKFFVVTVYSMVDSIINSFYLALRALDPKRNVSTQLHNLDSTRNV